MGKIRLKIVGDEALEKNKKKKQNKKKRQKGARKPLGLVVGKELWLLDQLKKSWRKLKPQKLRLKKKQKPARRNLKRPKRKSSPKDTRKMLRLLPKIQFIQSGMALKF